MSEIIDTGKDVSDECSVSVGLRQEHWKSEHAFHPGLSVLHRDFLYTLKAGGWDGMMQCVSFLHNDCTEMSLHQDGSFTPSKQRPYLLEPAMTMVLERLFTEKPGCLTL